MHSILMKVHPVGAELFHTDRQMNGQADLMKLIAHFRNFANAPKNYILILMVNFSINDSENMKQVQKIENYIHRPEDGPQWPKHVVVSIINRIERQLCFDVHTIY